MMAHLPARRARLILIAVLVLVSAGGAAAVQMTRHSAPRTAAEWMPTASAEPTPSSVAAKSAKSATPAPPLRPTTARAGSPRPRTSRAPDSVFVDPAVVTPAPQWDPNTSPTCEQWRSVLTDKQRTSYSSALLRAAWAGNGSARVAPASTVRAYHSAITEACHGTANVSDVARVVYAASPGTWRP
jgi:hypothetical protein